MGCGRTDAQVHASQYFLHFETSQTPAENFVNILNKLLPQDITVYQLIPVDDKQHARYDVTQRTYDYFIHTQKDSFLNDLSAYYPLVDPNLTAIKKACELLKNTHDFHNMCKTPAAHHTTLCQMHDVKLFYDEQKQSIRIQFQANRFLRGMIRIIVHHLIELAKNKIDIAQFETLLNEKKPSKNLKFAFPQGLYLSEIKYPHIDLKPQANFSLNKGINWILV